MLKLNTKDTAPLCWAVSRHVIALAFYRSFGRGSVLSMPCSKQDPIPAITYCHRRNDVLLSPFLDYLLCLQDNIKEMLIKEDVHNTALLLNISITEEETHSLLASLTQLIDYFAVMEKTLAEKTTNTAENSPHNQNNETQNTEANAIYREDKAVPHPESKSLIERSEEYEENYVIIPNIL